MCNHTLGKGRKRDIHTQEEEGVHMHTGEDVCWVSGGV